VASGTQRADMPQRLIDYLSGGRLVVAATNGPDGFPHTMVMNSAVAAGPHIVRFALDHRTQSLKNLRADARIMIEVIGDGMVYGVRGTAAIVREQMAHAPVPSALVEVTVEAVKSDLPPGVVVQAPVFSWGALEGFMAPIDPVMFEELRTFSA
jgi:flavin reductase (DIM6/NTAB) family NADH-FMN oxidoreductase RutF